MRFLAFSSNDPARYLADSPERMAQFVRDNDWPIPYAYDESQDVARALGSERTPEVFVLDAQQRLAYHGAPDGDHQDPNQNAAWLRAALDDVLAGREVERAETPARGCSVKWRAGPGEAFALGEGLAGVQCGPQRPASAVARRGRVGPRAAGAFVRAAVGARARRG